MPYALAAFFDADSDAHLRALREQMAAEGYGDPEAARAVRPHITFAMLDEVDPEALRPALRVFSQQIPALPISLATVGSFPTAEGVVFLGPVVTRSLLEVHGQLHRLLSDLSPVPYYAPDNWVPHCTVAINLPPEQVCGAIGVCRGADVYRSATLTQIALIEFPPTHAVYSFPLRGETMPETAP